MAAGAAKVESVKLSEVWADGNIRDDGWEKDIGELAAQIREQGLLQPVGVIEKENPEAPKQKYKIVFGHRRVAACRSLEYTHIDAVLISSKTTAQQEVLWRLIENLGRKNLSPMEEARAFYEAINTAKLGTTRELAAMIGKTGGYVSQRVALLKLPEDVQNALVGGEITTTHAREICRITDEKDQCRALERAKKMSPAQFEEYVAGLDDDEKKKTSSSSRAKLPKVGKDLPHSDEEVAQVLGDLDNRIKIATEESNRNKEAYYKGMLRGIAWSRNLGGITDLFSTP